MKLQNIGNLVPLIKSRGDAMHRPGSGIKRDSWTRGRCTASPHCRTFLRRCIMVYGILVCVFLNAIVAQVSFASSVRHGDEVKARSSTLLVGPFDLHRKYRSMEGPYIVKKVRVGDLVSSPQIVIPEADVQFVEGSNGAPPMAAPMNAAVSSGKQVDGGNAGRELFWFKSIKLQVLDENDKPLPTAEFICHLNVDVDLAKRDALFRRSDHAGNARIITLTQGQTNFTLPKGMAVPVCSDEFWTFTFQAANRTTDKHRRVKHLCTVEFVKDSDLPADRTFKALTWFNPYIAVAVKPSPSDETAHGPSCMMPSLGDNAPNMVAGTNVKDAEGRELAGHWAVPPGTHTYESPITEQLNRGFGSRDRRIHAVWTHVHPLCQESSLLVCKGDERQNIFTAKSKTSTKNGLQLERIDPVVSEEGILVPGGQKYVLQSTYDNTTSDTQDSMVAMGIFCADETFVKPDWQSEVPAKGAAAPQLVLSEGKDGVYCGIKPVAGGAQVCSAKPAAANYEGTDRYPLFDEKADGPLLDRERGLEILTSAGPIHIVVDPKIAPKNATQVFKLLSAGAFTGTQIHRYEPGFVLQISPVDAKAAGQPALTAEQQHLLRRLPLEVDVPNAGEQALHKQWVLSMARYEPKDSAVSSFSILLGAAPHLDHEYTVFGRVIPDEATLATIKSITDNWEKQHPFIVSVKADGR